MTPIKALICAVVTIVLGLITYTVALHNLMPRTPYSPGPVWINVFCREDQEFSNLQLNETNEWLHEMIEYCLNGSECSDYDIEILHHRKWRRDCNFTG